VLFASDGERADVGEAACDHGRGPRLGRARSRRAAYPGGLRGALGWPPGDSATATTANLLRAAMSPREA
jgi:hypothetical protein